MVLEDEPPDATPITTATPAPIAIMAGVDKRGPEPSIGEPVLRWGGCVVPLSSPEGGVEAGIPMAAANCICSSAKEDTGSRDTLRKQLNIKQKFLMFYLTICAMGL